MLVMTSNAVKTQHQDHYAGFQQRNVTLSGDVTLHNIIYLDISVLKLIS